MGQETTYKPARMEVSLPWVPHVKEASGGIECGPPKQPEGHSDTNDINAGQEESRELEQEDK